MRTFLNEIMPILMVAGGVLTMLLWLASPVFFLGVAFIAAGAGLMYWTSNRENRTPLQGF